MPPAIDRLPTHWFRFEDSGGARWALFLSVRARSQALRADKWGGPYVGRTLWRQRRIYVELNQNPQDFFDTVVHELGHVALRHVRLPGVIDEEIVRSFAEGMWPILGSIPTGWPPLPRAASEYLRGRGGWEAIPTSSSR